MGAPDMQTEQQKLAEKQKIAAREDETPFMWHTPIPNPERLGTWVVYQTWIDAAGMEKKVEHVRASYQEAKDLYLSKVPS